MLKVRVCVGAHALVTRTSLVEVENGSFCAFTWRTELLALHSRCFNLEPRVSIAARCDVSVCGTKTSYDHSQLLQSWVKVRRFELRWQSTNVYVTIKSRLEVGGDRQRAETSGQPGERRTYYRRVSTDVCVSTIPFLSNPIQRQTKRPSLHNIMMSSTTSTRLPCIRCCQVHNLKAGVEILSLGEKIRRIKPFNAEF